MFLTGVTARTLNGVDSTRKRESVKIERSFSMRFWPTGSLSERLQKTIVAVPKLQSARRCPPVRKWSGSSALEADKLSRRLLLKFSDFLAKLEDLTALPAGASQQDNAVLHYELRQPGKGDPFAMGGRRRDDRQAVPWPGCPNRSPKPGPRGPCKKWTIRLALSGAGSVASWSSGGQSATKGLDGIRKCKNPYRKGLPGIGRSGREPCHPEPVERRRFDSRWHYQKRPGWRVVHIAIAYPHVASIKSSMIWRSAYFLQVAWARHGE